MSSNVIDTLSISEKNVKLYELLSFCYYVIVLIALLFSARLVELTVPFTNYKITISASTWIIPLTFFFQDIVCEVFGYAKAVRLVNTSTVMLLVLLLYGKIVSYMPSPEINNISNEYTTLFNVLPRHFFALFLAINISSQVNITLLMYLKVWRWFGPLTYRIIGSSFVGIIVYQLVGTSMAWWGKLSFIESIIPYIIFSILYKIAVEIMLTPICVMLINLIKFSPQESIKVGG